MSTSSNTAKYLYIIAITLIAIGGFVYAIMQEFMPYHAIAVGQQWHDIAAPMRVLLIATLNADGGLMVCIAFAMTLLLCIPFKRGEVWASWAITCIGSSAMLTGLRSAIYVDINTAANPPWFVFLIVIFLLFIALTISVRHHAGINKQNQNL
jgi:hypothetical protein